MPDGQIIMHQRSYIEHCFRENDMELIKGGVTLPSVDEKGSPESPIDQYGHPTEFEKIKIHLSEVHWPADVASYSNKARHLPSIGRDCFSNGD